MLRFMPHLKNEDGFILVLGMSILVVLTLLGTSAIKNSVIDLKIAGNEREAAQNFFVADAIWQLGGIWLNQQPTAPSPVNLTPKNSGETVDTSQDYYAIVRNYGNGGDGVTNDTFSASSSDGDFQNISFWYRVLYRGDSIAQKFGKGYRDFREEIQTSADARSRVAAHVYKVYKVGY